MSTKSIPLKTWEVQATLDNRKSVTRQVVKMDRHSIYKAACAAGRWSETFGGEIPDEVAEWYAREMAKPPYKTGDILWVRETWERFECSCCEGDREGRCFKQPDKNNGCYMYKATDEIYGDARWHPSIHMPKAAARLFLRVKSVRVERLQTMDVINCVREGATWHEYPCAWTVMAKPAFIELWDSTIKPADLQRYGWNANPFVWVVEFERCEKPEGWL